MHYEFMPRNAVRVLTLDVLTVIGNAVKCSERSVVKFCNKMLCELCIEIPRNAL